MATATNLEPFRVRVRIRPTFAQLAKEWLAKDAPRLRPKTVKEYTRVLHREVVPALGHLPADRIGSRDVATFLNTLADRPGIRRNAFTVLSSIYSWARKQGVVGANPAQGLNPPKANIRDRVLTEKEIREAWHAAPFAGDYGRILRLCLLTGCRREEIAALTWPEVNLPARQLELPGSRTKNRRPHVVPLSDLALAQLPQSRQQYPHLFGSKPGRPFGGWHWGSVVLSERLGYEPTWTPHDLRRTLVTFCAERGLAEPHILEAGVNHISGHKAGVAGIYNRAAYAQQKVALFEAWSLEVSRIVGSGT